MLASPLFWQTRKDCKTSRIPIAPGKPASMIQERGTSAKRTRADLRKSLMSSSSQEPSAPKKLAALCSQFMSSVFKNADPLNLGRSLLECNKDHLLSQARSEIVKQGHHVDSLKNCISELQQQTHAQRLELQNAQHGFVESRWEEVRLQEELSMKEKVLRDTQIRSMHEMGDMKRAQCNNWEKIMRQYNGSLHNCRRCKNRWILWMIQGDFKKWNRIMVGKCLTFPVNLQWFQAAKRLPLDTCKQSDDGKTFLVIIFYIDSSRNHPQGIHSCAPQRERRSVPQAAGSETLFPRDDNSIQKSSLYLSDFPSEAMLWIKGVEMVDSIEEFAINCWQ